LYLPKFKVHGSVHRNNILIDIQQDATLHSLFYLEIALHISGGRGQLKCDGTRADTRFRLSAKRTSPFKSAGASVQSTTGSRCVRISGSTAGYTMFQGSVKGTGYPLHSPVSPLLPLPCVTVCHHISTGVYNHPSSEAQTTVSTAFGICHNFTAICRYRGRVGTGMSVASATHSTLRPVPTLLR
jgi:hypothetical protein